MDLQESLLRRAGPLPRAAADMRHLPVADGAFDLVLNLWNSFGYFLDEAEEAAALAEFRRVLRPGGLVLLHSDLDTRAVAEGRWVQHMKVPLGDEALFLVREVPAPERAGLVCLSWVVLPGEAPWQSPPFFLRVLDDGDWERLARAAGYRDLRIARTPAGAVPHETLVSLLA
jgi:SAM-dependent methyltransferase